MGTLLNRRRYMGGGEPDIIKDGLLLWFDGLNKGDSPSTVWEPVYSDISGFSLSTVGSPTVVDNGYVCSHNNLLQSTSNPFIYTRNGYTIIFCISNTDAVSSTDGDRSLLSINTSSGNNNNRGEFFVRGSQYNLAIWFNGINTIESSVGVNLNDSGCFAIGSTSSSSIYAKKTSSAFIVDTKTSGKIPSDTSSLVIAISNYLANGRYGGSVAGTYHAFVMYDRVLTQNEIEYVTNFLNKRYIQ